MTWINGLIYLRFCKRKIWEYNELRG